MVYTTVKELIMSTLHGERDFFLPASNGAKVSIPHSWLHLLQAGHLDEALLRHATTHVRRLGVLQEEK